MYTPEELAVRKRELAPIIGMSSKPTAQPIPKAVAMATDMEGLEDPKLLRNLPENYEVVFTDPAMAGKMQEFARKLRYKHHNWSKARLMRKCFEEFPSVRIRIK